MKRKFNNLIWLEVIWPRPFDFTAIQDLLTHLAGAHLYSPIIWEIRSTGGRIHYFIGVDEDAAYKVKNLFIAHGNIQFSQIKQSGRKVITTVKQLQISKPVLSLKTDNAMGVARAVLAVLNQVSKDEEMAVQIVFGPSFTPSPLPDRIQDPHASWLNIISGNIAPASHESRKSLKEKKSYHGFSCQIRIGSNKPTNIALAHIRNLLSAFRMLEAAGVHIRLVNDNADNLNSVRIPWHFPLRLSVKEIANFLVLPIGDEEFSGVNAIHPKLLFPPDWMRNSDKSIDFCFAKSISSQDESLKIRLCIPPRDSLEHTIVLGPTGSGKSNVLLSLILANINAGRSILVIDPKADLVNDILARIPPERADDVVVIDPSDSSPVGINPFSICNDQNQELVADAILAVFKEIFADSWGIRSQDILSSAFLTLAKMKGSSLILLPALLTNAHFRKMALRNIDDKIGLEPFWAGFEGMGTAERSQAIAPVLNKIRQFLLRSGLRNVLGQANPKFSLSDLFDKRRIVLVPLNKGLIGSESARLLGSLIVGLTWTLALNRAKQPPERRQIVNVFIDELQDYLSLPTDLSDALAQARGLGVGLVLAHQYRSQLSSDIRASIDANARNKIVFGLNSNDARDMASMAPELDPLDFMLLPRYHIYASLQVHGRNSGWISGQTLPPIAALQPPVELKAKSMERYGQDAEIIKSEYLKMLGITSDEDSGSNNQDINSSNDSIGRKKR